MSSAFYPLGMNSYNNRLPQGGYKSWKGTGINSFPVGITPGTIRPFTNKDYTNYFTTGFGLPHPIKHYRIGRGFNYPVYVAENKEIVVNRAVKSSTGGNLVKQLIDDPGAYNVFQNQPGEISNDVALDSECVKCKGIGVVVNYKPNISYLTEDPEPTTQNAVLCCNEEKKALERVVYASTNLKKNYYTTHKQYLQNRCKLYDQRAFNFLSPNVGINGVSKPGSPDSLLNIYLANCQCNAEIYEATENALATKIISGLYDNGYITNEEKNAEIESGKGKLTISDAYNYIQTLSEPYKTQANVYFTAFVNNPYWGIPITGPVAKKSCSLVEYKPNNYKFAKQGAVSSSTRILKLKVNTIEKNAVTFKKDINYNPPVYFNSSSNPFILKSKVEQCNPGYYHKDGNPKTCQSLAPVDTNKVSQNAGRNGYKTFVQNITG